MGGPGAVATALAWLYFKLRFYRQINTENRTSHKTVQDLRSVIAVARQLESYLLAQMGVAAYGSPALVEEAARATSLLVDLNKTLSAAQDNVF